MAYPIPRANISASSVHGDQAGQGERAERGGGQHECLGDEQEAAAVDQVTDRGGRHRERHDRQAAHSGDQRHVGRRSGERQHQPLRADRLHPAADIADELGGPYRREQPVPERRPRRASGGADCALTPTRAGPAGIVRSQDEHHGPGRPGRRRFCWRCTTARSS
jgi:hypothetical protein